MNSLAFVYGMSRASQQTRGVSSNSSGWRRAREREEKGGAAETMAESGNRAGGLGH